MTDNITPLHLLSHFDQVPLVVSIGRGETTPVLNDNEISTVRIPARITHHSIRSGLHRGSGCGGDIDSGMDSPFPTERTGSLPVGRTDPTSNRISFGSCQIKIFLNTQIVFDSFDPLHVLLKLHHEVFDINVSGVGDVDRFQNDIFGL